MFDMLKKIILMTKTTILFSILTCMLCVGLVGCNEELLDDTTKYDRPEWLAGKVYTQVKEQEELSTFATCIERIGYDSVIDVSGSYTVFAPTNQAFDEYFQNHPDYNSIDEIPNDVLDGIVKYHIVQNPWTKEQLRSLDVYGWIDSLDLNNNKPRGYKRETLLRPEDRNYGVVLDRGRVYMADTNETNWHRRVITESRKLAPIFYQEYFDIYNLNTNDYEYYFNRPFGAVNDLYYVGGFVEGDEIFAENGFVYRIDKVVDPLRNAYEIVSNGRGDLTYNTFLSLLHQFPEFSYNEQETFDQPGAEQGLQVDSLFDLRFPDLAFDITNEETTPPSGTFGLPNNVSIRYHHGVAAPTDQAMQDFINTYLVGPNRWGSIEDAPRNIKRIIANTHLSPNPIYPGDFTNGFYNGEQDVVNVNEENIVHKEYGSNCTFVGLNKAIAPRAFSSVTGPVYLQRGYSRVMNAVEESGLLSALKRRNENYMFFVESDVNLSQDSSLLYDPIEEEFFLYQVTGADPREFPVTTNDLRTLILNHVATDLPTGVPRKEFIKNLAGNYITVNNETGEISGTAPTTIGYSGVVFEPNFPTQLTTNADNGITYSIDNWFSFAAGSIYNLIESTHPHFHSLLKKAGFALEKEFRYSFISENELYTVFVPTAEALNEAQADTLSGQALKDFVLMHFIQGDLIFTDGKKQPAYYETARIDEKSTAFTTVFTQIFVNPGIDQIQFPDASGNEFALIEEADGITNALTGRTVETEDNDNPTFPMIVNNGVVHVVNKAFSKSEMDTN